MEQINSLLNLPEYATASDRACAVYELMQEHENIQAACASAEHELMALREATSHIFAESICAARGITDADAQEDIRAAWCADPYAALNALAGDNITAANPYGCNQYGHEWRGKHGEGWKPRGDRQRDKKKDKEDKQKGKNLADALKKLSPRMDKNGQGLMPFASNKSNNMSESLAKFLTNDIYEIALEEGGYESIYDAPKDKLKAAILKELQATPQKEADALGDDTSDSYKWWRKRKEKIAKSLES